MLEFFIADETEHRLWLVVRIRRVVPAVLAHLMALALSWAVSFNVRL
jgi:hypothetical protein